MTWEVGKDATEAVGTSRNEILEQLWDWYLRVPGAELPERPPAELLQKLFAAWLTQQDAIRELALTISCPTCKVRSGPCVAGRLKKPTESLHRSRLTAATALYGAQRDDQQ